MSVTNSIACFDVEDSTVARKVDVTNHWRELFGDQPVESPHDFYYCAAIAAVDPQIGHVLDRLSVPDDILERACSLAYDAIHIAVALTLENVGIADDWQSLVTRLRGGRAPLTGKWISSIHEDCPPETPHGLYLNEVIAAIEHECSDAICELDTDERTKDTIGHMIFDAGQDACFNVLETAGISDEWPDLLATIKAGAKVQAKAEATEQPAFFTLNLV